MRLTVAKFLRRTLEACEGNAAIEFALIFPLMILIYVGGFEITRALYAYRKVSVTARAVADLASQYMSMTETDLSNVMTASVQVMVPFPASKTTIVLSEVTTTSTTGQALVTWSRSLNASPRACNTLITSGVPASAAGVPYVLAEIGYTFNPVGDGALSHPLLMRDQIYMLPRQSASISAPSPCSKQD